MMNETTTPVNEACACTEESCNDVSYRPDVDIIEGVGAWTIRIDMPGANRDAIDIEFERGSLLVRAAVARRAANAKNVLLREYGIGDYARRFTVGQSIDATNITASYEEGVLTLHLPKVAKVTPRRINVLEN